MTALEALALKQQEQLAAAYQQAYALEMFRANLFAVLSPRTTRLLEVLNARAEKLRSELYARGVCGRVCHASSLLQYTRIGARALPGYRAFQEA
jgi:hypothetical protein